jgi:hypothetical protein
MLANMKYRAQCGALVYIIWKKRSALFYIIWKKGSALFYIIWNHFPVTGALKSVLVPLYGA